jgi:hypothetical protein
LFEGACYIKPDAGTVVSINASSFSFCTTSVGGNDKDGGGVQFAGNGVILVTNCNFSDCMTQNWGGAMQMRVSTTIANCIFERCWAAGHFFSFFF